MCFGFVSIIRSLDGGLNTALVLVDFSRAFDTINHKLLLSILHYVGLSPNAVNFCDNYLSKRTQRVRILSKVSGSVQTISGVSQGSILGPLLYNIYTSNMYNCLISSTYHLYADDSQIFFSFKTEDVTVAERLLNSDLERLFQASVDHGLGVNPAKSSVLLFCSRKDRSSLERDLCLTLGSCDVKFCEVAKNLGVYLDVDLRFREHTCELVRRAYTALRAIYPIRHMMSTRVRRILCDALVLSHFNFCDVVYGPCLDVFSSSRIQRIQNSCLRFIFGLPRRCRTSLSLKLIGWLNMIDRRYLLTCLFVHKIIVFKSPPYLLARLSFRTDVHHLNLRHRGLLSIPKHRTSLFRKSFSFFAVSIYNSLPISVRSLSPQSLRERVMLVLCSKY